MRTLRALIKLPIILGLLMNKGTSPSVAKQYLRTSIMFFIFILDVRELREAVRASKEAAIYYLLLGFWSSYILNTE